MVPRKALKCGKISFV